MTTLLEPQILPADRGDAFWFINSLTTVKSTADSTGGAFSLVQQLMPPGFQTPYHLHHNEDEAFYILDGQATFFLNGNKFMIGKGGYLFLPRQQPHGFRIEPARSGPVSMLVLATPGNEFQGFMQEMATPAEKYLLPYATPPDMQKMVELCTKYNIDVLGPLPG